MIMMMPLMIMIMEMKMAMMVMKMRTKLPLARKGWVIYWRWQEALMLYGCLPPTPHY